MTLSKGCSAVYQSLKDSPRWEKKELRAGRKCKKCGQPLRGKYNIVCKQCYWGIEKELSFSYTEIYG